MILYKYVSFSDVEKIIFGNSIRFTPVNYLNDPFEATSFSFRGLAVTDRLAASAFKERINSRFSVLSLTRQPLNTLMWAHYGLSHSGAVIGIDVDRAGLNDPKKSLICAEDGEVVYSATKPCTTIGIENYENILLEDIESLHFKASASNFFRRAFLYKSLEWAYEEEVRIVKSVSHNGVSVPKTKDLIFENKHGKWIKKSVDNRPLFLFNLPKGSIKELYLGSNAYSHNVSQLRIFTHDKFSEILTKIKNIGINIYITQPEFGSWSLTARERSSA